MTDLIFNFLPGYFSDLLGIPISTNPRIVINVVAVLLLLFLGWYVGQAVRALICLGRAVRDLEKVRQQKSDGEIVTKDDLQQVFRTAFFASVWNSYRDTLHEQYNYQGGQKHLECIRSTMPSEAVFSPQSLVDARLNIEFFKHLPGILTGIGIIGTFYGLITGIQHFDPSLLAKAKSDPAQMDRLFVGLKVLFDEVQGAFIASFFAIGAAMLITLLEKVLLNVCYRKLEQLCRILDALYEGGVGEDYLAALVKSSAENATQTAQLKASLVTDLTQLLFQLSDAQGKQSEVLGNLLSAKIQEHIDASEHHGERFRAELKEGLADIGKTVAGVTDGQGDTMTGMLEGLIKTFSDNIQNTFGDQMKGQAEMMNTAIASMTEMQAGFKELLQDLRDSGKTEREDLTSKVISLVGALESQQGKLEAQMMDIIKGIQDRIVESQTKTSEQVDTSIEKIQSSVGTILAKMEDERKIAAAGEQKRQQEFSEKSTDLIKTVESQVGDLVNKIADTTVALKDNVTALNNTSIDSIKGMKQGATLISSAAEHFVEAGNKVSGVIKQAETVSAQLTKSADSLAQASSSLDSQLSQYATTRDALARMVGEMNGMLERAKDEAGMNQQVIQKMQQTVNEFEKLNAIADKSFDAISEKLAETLTKFRQDMAQHDSELHIHHADTLNQVASAYEPLAASIAGLTDMVAKTRHN
ncbi:MAG: methyl-accepting chemotaxis protein [Methylobacter sp.]|nr:MAG: methyl-accepting chemotaxis protein [Methylobacter sp.]